MIKYINNNDFKKIINFSEFIYKIYNYYLVNFDNYFKNFLLQNINSNFIYCIIIRGIYLIEKIFIYNIYIGNKDIQNLQNISKKVIDLYIKFIEQIISINVNINLSIKDAEIFIYKKFLDSKINNFNKLLELDIDYINIIKVNNKLLIDFINNYDIKNYNSSNILNYKEIFLKYIKDNYKIIKNNKKIIKNNKNYKKL